jgi:hypothetical protein
MFKKTRSKSGFFILTCSSSAKKDFNKNQSTKKDPEFILLLKMVLRGARMAGAMPERMKHEAVTVLSNNINSGSFFAL